MSAKERVRLDVLARVGRGEVTVVAAAGLMGVSLRQARRLWKRYRAEGDAGLVHRLRGRVGNRRLDDDARDRLVKRHQERYSDFGPTLACEKLAEEGFVLSPDTLVRVLKERNLWQRRRRRSRHRRRRERRACFGELVQMDGSHHDWFEGRAEVCVLMVAIDDATSHCFARFYPAETTEAAFDALGRWARKHGLPRALYVDRHSIYRNEQHPEVPTQFGRAMGQLGVELICANSPQAKGRVERRNGLFQDRLVKDLRLRGIDSMRQANTFLEGKFLPDLNRRYAVRAAQDQDLHRAASHEELKQTLCVQEERVVGRDWCVRWKNRWLQIERGSAVLPGRRVLVRQLAGGELTVEHAGRMLPATEVARRPRPESEPHVIVNNRSWKPPKTHPWAARPAVASRSQR